LTAHASEQPSSGSRTDAVAVCVASVAIVVALVGVAFRPVLLTPVAAILGLASVLMSARWRTLSAAAVAIAGLAWVAGMTVAVLTKHPLF
jgi:hypothetical protein